MQGVGLPGAGPRLSKAWNCLHCCAWGRAGGQGARACLREDGSAVAPGLLLAARRCMQQQSFTSVTGSSRLQAHASAASAWFLRHAGAAWFWFSSAAGAAWVPAAAAALGAVRGASRTCFLA